MKRFFLHFCFPIVFMGIFVRFYFNPPAIIYLSLLPYGIVTYYYRAVYVLNKYKKKTLAEIYKQKDPQLLKAIPMKYLCKMVAIDGIGYFYADWMSFKSNSGEIQMEIFYTDIAHIDRFNNMYILKGVLLHLKNDKTFKFVADKQDLENILSYIPTHF